MITFETIFPLLSSGGMSRREIAAELDVDARDPALSEALADGVARGALERRGSAYGLVGDSEVASRAQGDIPKAPKGLGEAGKATWAECWSLPWTVKQDRGQVHHLCLVEDQAQAIHAQILKDGLTRERPIVTPRGDVVGSELAANPLLDQARKIDVQLQSLRGTLGLDPKSRSRAGFELVERKPDRVDELVEQRRQRLAETAQGANGGGWPGSHNGHKR